MSDYKRKAPNRSVPSSPAASGRSPNDAVPVDACERVSGERYQAFIENIEEGVYEVDLRGNFLYFNNSLCKVFGYPREQIAYQNYSKFMTETLARKAEENFNKIYKTGKGFSDLIWEIVDARGKTRVIELSANLIKDGNGNAMGFRGIARDITEKFMTQTALQESERRNRLLLDFVPYPMVVFSLDGRVSYLNPAFEETFGWRLDELKGKKIPYVPPERLRQTEQNIRDLLKERRIVRQETQRLTKDGRLLDVVMWAIVYAEEGNDDSGELVILRDVTQEKRIKRHNEAMLRISLALPEYPQLDDLLSHISAEAKTLLDVEGALVILLDEEKKELFFKSAAHDDQATEKRIKEIRFPASEGISGRVIRSGKPIMVPDTSKSPDFYNVVDIQAGFETRNLLDVPLRSGDRIIGVLCAMNKKRGMFDETDTELMNMIAGTVALSIENARFSEELKSAYREVSSLNRAKDRVINHLSHELKTPIAVLGASLGILDKRVQEGEVDKLTPTLARARRNLDRILEMEYEIEDIMRDAYYEPYHLLTRLLMECSDEIEALIALETGEVDGVERIRTCIQEEFLPKETPPESILLGPFVQETLDEIRPDFSHRRVDLMTRLEPSPPVTMPRDALRKIVVGLVRNAVENTPDGGKIEIETRASTGGTEMIVRDYGVGIVADNQRRIFEGFFSTQETMDYATKGPFDFNAGGKGADLLRMKIFSERFGFKIDMISTRCAYIPDDKNRCPGAISRCAHAEEKRDCYESGGTTFTLFFPSLSES